MVEIRVTDEGMKSVFGDIMTVPEDVALRICSSGKARYVNPITADGGKERTDPKNAVNIIAYVQQDRKMGGAEISNETVIQYGLGKGYKIEQVTPRNFNEQILKKAKLIILNNIVEFSVQQFTILMKTIFDKKNYIKYDHDLTGIKRPQMFRQIYGMSNLNIFISPAHRDYVLSALSLDSKNSIVLPLAIDTSKFTNTNNKREHNSVLVPSYHKGKLNVCAYIKSNPDKYYTIISNDSAEILSITGNVSHIKFLDKQTQGQMAEQYNCHEYMLHLPEKLWAGERIYFEAILCGCKPIVNENVGHFSWQVNGMDVQGMLDNAIVQFWERISGLYDKNIKI